MVPPIVLLPAGSHDVNGEPSEGVFVEWPNPTESNAIAHWDQIGSYDTAEGCEAALASGDVEATARFKIEHSDSDHARQLKHHYGELIAAVKEQKERGICLSTDDPRLKGN